MEKELLDLERSVQKGDWETACDIVEKFDEKQLEDIPIKYLRIMIDKGSDRACRLAVGILERLAPQKKEALHALLHHSKSEQSIVRLRAVTALSRLPGEVLSKIPLDSFKRLTKDKKPEFRVLGFDILGSIAMVTPEKVHKEEPSDTEFLREKEDVVRQSILRLSKIVNPIEREDLFVTINTRFLVNWTQKEMNSTRVDIYDLVAAMQNRYVATSHELTKIGNLVTNSCAVDAFLFMTPKRYRGHEVHRFNVGTLGLFLLKTNVSESESLEEYIAQLKGLTPEDVEKAWLISAFLHDHAIPLRFMLQIAPIVYDLKTAYKTYPTLLKRFCEVLDEAYNQVFSTALRGIYQSFLDGEKDLLPLQDFVSQELHKIGCPYSPQEGEKLPDHGPLGAANLTTYLRPLAHELIYGNEIIRNSARAIALHSSSCKIKFNEEPIAFLLVLCDEAQEWGREISVLPSMVSEFSSVKIGPFRYKEGRRYFEDELVVDFGDPPKDEILEEIGFDYNEFISHKKAAFDRLCSEPKIKPNKVGYTIKELTQKSFKKL